MAGLQGPVGEYTGGSQILDIGRLRVQIDEDIDYLNVDKSLLLMLLGKVGKESVGRMEHEWQIQERKKDFVATTAVGGDWFAGADTTGTLTVATADAWLFSEGDIILIPSKSDQVSLYVNSVVQATGVITAQVVDTASDTIDLSTGGPVFNLFLISNSFESGTGVGTIKSEQPTRDSNFVQIVQTPMGITTTAKNLNYRGINEFDKQKFELMIDHAFKMEKNLFFGRRKKLDTGLMGAGYEQWFMGGVRDFLTTHVVDASGALTRAEFDDWVVDCTQYGKGTVIFTGELVFEALTAWSENRLEVVRTESTHGMSVTKYQTAYGDIVPLTPHRELFTGDLGGVGFCLDIADLKYRFLQGLDTHVEVDVHTPGDKQKIDEIRTWMSLKVGNEKRHGYLYGVTSIDASSY